ncbi:MAG: STAS domain-containing protein [Litorivicinus sp.]
MDCGIEIAKSPDRWVFVFKGDVRLSLCTTLDDLIASLFEQGTPVQVLIDLSAADNIDSTCLGLLAKLAMHYQSTNAALPVIHCPNADLVDLIESLGLESLFEWRDEAIDVSCQRVELKGCEPAAAQSLVLSAHEALAELNHANQAQFDGLIRALKTAD